MKGPSNSDAHSDPHSAGAAYPTPAAVNPYTKGDKVRTKLGGKGEDVEAEVTAVWKDEVQVKTPDGELRWRTVRTVQAAVVLLVPPDSADVIKAEKEVSKPASGAKVARIRKRRPKK